MSKYRISRQADTDLEGIADYIADFNPTAASDVLDTLHNTFAFLARKPEARNPSRGPPTQSTSLLAR